MKKQLIHWLGLTGIVALLSYAAAVVFSPVAYPGYDWMAQAVSDLSAEAAPSRPLWNQLSAPHNVCSVVCATSVALFASQERVSSRLFRVGLYLFMRFQPWAMGRFRLQTVGRKLSPSRKSCTSPSRR